MRLGADGVSGYSGASASQARRRLSHRLADLPVPAVFVFLPSHAARHNLRYDIIDGTKGTMKVTIREWNAVAAWRWDMPDDDVCGICRNPYDSTCSKCKFPGDECPLCKLRLTARYVMNANSHAVLGECNHSFHMVHSPCALMDYLLIKPSIASTRGSDKRHRNRSAPCADNVSIAIVHTSSITKSSNSLQA